MLHKPYGLQALCWHYMHIIVPLCSSLITVICFCGHYYSESEKDLMQATPSWVDYILVTSKSLDWYANILCSILESSVEFLFLVSSKRLPSSSTSSYLVVKNKDIYHYERIYSKGLKRLGICQVGTEALCITTNLSNEFQLAMKYEGKNFSYLSQLLLIFFYVYIYAYKFWYPKK